MVESWSVRNPRLSVADLKASLADLPWVAFLDRGRACEGRMTVQGYTTSSCKNRGYWTYEFLDGAIQVLCLKHLYTRVYTQDAAEHARVDEWLLGHEIIDIEGNRPL